MLGALPPPRSFTTSLAAQCTTGDDTTLLQTAELVKRDHAGPTKIPCVIHQTWRDLALAVENGLIVGKHKRWVQTWLRMNPNCEHKLWTDAQLEELARTKSPDAGNAWWRGGGWYDDVIWPIWGGLSPIERADVFRYLVLWDQGGYYADLDVTSVKPIKDYDIPKEATMILWLQENLHRFPPRVYERQPPRVLPRVDNTMIRTEQFENWFLASAPGSPISRFRCLQMVREKFGWKIQSALDLTGPGTLSDSAGEHPTWRVAGAWLDTAGGETSH
eukprot:Skav207955  [mRNA]  locus=scaffold108:424010:431064:+ [translate_table: standard]